MMTATAYHLPTLADTLAALTTAADAGHLAATAERAADLAPAYRAARRLDTHLTLRHHTADALAVVAEHAATLAASVQGAAERAAERDTACATTAADLADALRRVSRRADLLAAAERADALTDARVAACDTALTATAATLAAAQVRCGAVRADLARLAAERASDAAALAVTIGQTDRAAALARTAAATIGQG